MVNSKESREGFSTLPSAISLEQQEFKIIFTELLTELRKRASWHWTELHFLRSKTISTTIQ